MPLKNLHVSTVFNYPNIKIGSAVKVYSTTYLTFAFIASINTKNLVYYTYPVGIRRYASACVAAPPCSTTVAMTINEVVVNIACRASDTVLRMAKAKDIAPRKPGIQMTD